MPKEKNTKFCDINLKIIWSGKRVGNRYNRKEKKKIKILNLLSITEYVAEATIKTINNAYKNQNCALGAHKRANTSLRVTFPLV